VLYSFHISYACSHKDIAYLLVEIYCLKVACSESCWCFCVAVGSFVSGNLNLRPSLQTRIEAKPHESQFIILQSGEFLFGSSSFLCQHGPLQECWWSTE
jgi:hypothetical protein